MSIIRLNNFNRCRYLVTMYDLKLFTLTYLRSRSLSTSRHYQLFFLLSKSPYFISNVFIHRFNNNLFCFQANQLICKFIACDLKLKGDAVDNIRVQWFTLKFEDIHLDVERAKFLDVRLLLPRDYNERMRSSLVHSFRVKFIVVPYVKRLLRSELYTSKIFTSGNVWQ